MGHLATADPLSQGHSHPILQQRKSWPPFRTHARVLTHGQNTLVHTFAKPFVRTKRKCSCGGNCAGRAAVCITAGCLFHSALHPCSALMHAGRWGSPQASGAQMEGRLFGGLRCAGVGAGGGGRGASKQGRQLFSKAKCKHVSEASLLSPGAARGERL